MRQIPARYTPLDDLGRGGMAVVQAAWDARLCRTVALKRPRDPDDLHQAICLGREGSFLASLAHPNVVAIHDAAGEFDEPFIALELVAGPTLAAWLAAAPRQWRHILAAFIAAGHGLAAVHAASIVHRDVKPANILLGRDGRPRLADFGLAIGRDELDDVVSVASGTPAYMAPEQSAGERACPQSDQYSFALALHEALWSDRPPGARVPARPAARARVVGRVPLRLRDVVQRAAHPDRTRRYPDMPALLTALAWAAR